MPYMFNAFNQFVKQVLLQIPFYRRGKWDRGRTSNLPRSPGQHLAGWGFGPGLWQSADQVYSSAVKTLGWAVRNGEQNCWEPGGKSWDEFGMVSRGLCTFRLQRGSWNMSLFRTEGLSCRVKVTFKNLVDAIADSWLWDKEQRGTAVKGLTEDSQEKSSNKNSRHSLNPWPRLGTVLSTLHVMSKQPEAFSFEIKNMQSFIVQPLGNFSSYLLIHKFYTILTWNNEVLYFKYSYTFKWGSF